MSEPLSDIIDVSQLPGVKIDPAQLPTLIDMIPIVGNEPNVTITRKQLHDQFPMSMIAMAIAGDLLKRTITEDEGGLVVGPTFDELLDLATAYLESRLQVMGDADSRDVWIYRYRSKVLDVLENAVAGAVSPGGGQVPMLGDPAVLDTAAIREFRWIADRGEGSRCHLNMVPCHSPLEVAFADFLDDADDVDRYMKNEHFGFAITYLEGGRARQYYPDFVIASKRNGGERWVVAETKGEVWPNTDLKSLAARQWCERMTAGKLGTWEYLFVPQAPFEKILKGGTRSLAMMMDRLRAVELKRANPAD